MVRGAAWRRELEAEVEDANRAPHGFSEVNTIHAPQPSSSCDGCRPLPRTWAVAEATAALAPTEARDMLIESSDGTLAFRAPETYAQGLHCGRTADIWSLGVTLYAMLFGILPFPFTGDDGSTTEIPSDVATGVYGAGDSSANRAQHELLGAGEQVDETSGASTLRHTAVGTSRQAHITIQEVEDAICSAKLRFPAAPDVTRSAKTLLKAMLMKQPEQRANLKAIAKHPWLTEEGAHPLHLPQVSEPLRASLDEIYHAISARAPALDLSLSNAGATASLPHPHPRTAMQRKNSSHV
jgi:serine/threonine protein kinase